MYRGTWCHFFGSELKAKTTGGVGSGDELIRQFERNHGDVIGKFEDDVDTVKKWMKEWKDGLKTVTKAQDKWTMKNSELTQREKALQKQKEDLIYDQKLWYSHKNHILRRFYYFTKQVWWERFMVHEFQVL